MFINIYDLLKIVISVFHQENLGSFIKKLDNYDE